MDLSNEITARGSSKALGGALVFLLLLDGCAPGRGGEIPVRVILPQDVNPAPVAPGPGAPRVRVAVDPPSSSAVVELHELAGWDRVPYSIQGRWGVHRESVPGSS
jgi:hypothetical protein